MTDWLSGWLSTMPWPFPVRPSLDNLTDPEMRASVAVTLAELGLAALLLAVAAMVRGGRVVVLLVAVTLIFMQAPTLQLLLVEAWPTSYRLSPTGFTAASIAAGRTVFVANCVACHGEKGDGVGGAGPLADLRQPHVWEHTVGDLFWFVSHGINGPDGGPLMPAFENILPEHARWSAIDYVHALNAGAVTKGLAGWPHRVTAPEIPLACNRLTARGLAGLRGKAVRLILGRLTDPIVDLAPVNGIQVVTIWLPEAATVAESQAGVDCVASGGAEAYAILAGQADGHVTPARFLIDPSGVLRSVWRMDDGDAWSDPERLLEEVRAICTEPLSLEPGHKHEHHD